MIEAIVRRTGWIAIFAISLSRVEAQSDEIAEISQRLAVKIAAKYDESGDAIREILVATGLSPQDSDRIGRAYVDGLLNCLIGAARLEAEEQSVSFEEVLLAFEVALDDPEHNEPTIIDMDLVDAEAERCALVEMEKAGISVELLIQHDVDSLIESEDQ